MPKQNKEYILMDNLGSKQSVNETWAVYVILKKKKNHLKMLQKVGAEN